jgi:hypothetical protein
VTTYTIPVIDNLTLAELDDVVAITGIDVTDPATRQLRPMKVAAALIVWQANRAGNPVTFDHIYTTLRAGDIVTATPQDAEGNEAGPPVALSG